MANEIVFQAPDWYDMGFQVTNGGGYMSGWWQVGYNKDPGYSGYANGALRARNVQLHRGQGIVDAFISIYVTATKGDSIWMKTYGIAEDNTGDFSGDPFGRQKTNSSTGDDYVYQTRNGDRINIGVTQMVRDIINRGGWNYGNNMGFLTFGLQNSSHGNQSNYFESFLDSYLCVRLASEPAYKPTPQTLVIPLLPPASKMGLKIAQQGVSVMSATRKQLIYTSDEKLLKVIAEGDVTVSTPWQPIEIPHGQATPPAVLAYMDKNGVRHKMPIYGAGWIGSDSSKVQIYTNASKVYYYIFNDKLS